MKKFDEFLSLALIEPKLGPWGPYPPQKVDSLWGSYLDFSSNPKLNPFWSQPNLFFNPEGPPQPDLEPRGPDLILDLDKSIQPELGKGSTLRYQQV